MSKQDEVDENLYLRSQDDAETGKAIFCIYRASRSACNLLQLHHCMKPANRTSPPKEPTSCLLISKTTKSLGPRHYNMNTLDIMQANSENQF